MIKAVWLIVLCGVVVAMAAAVRIDGGALVATTVAETEPTTVGVSSAQDSASESSVMKRAAGDDTSNVAVGMMASGTDTLTKADRLDVAPAPAPTETASAPVAALEPPPAAAPAPAPAKPAPKTADRSRHDAHAKMIAVPSPARQVKTTPPKKNTTVARAKAETKPPCRRPDGFAGLLRSLNIGPRCAT